MNEPVWVAGVGMTPFGVREGLSVADLARDAVSDALSDAGVPRSRVEVAFYGNTAQGALEGQLMVGGQIVLREMGFERIPMFNVENACATGSTALHLAVSHVRSGAAEIALAVGVEKMNVGDRAKRFTIFDGAYDVRDPDGMRRLLAEIGGDDQADAAGNRSVFMDIYAAWARAHMAKFGTTQQQIAAVAAKNHKHAVDNPRAHFRREMSVAEIMAARPLAYPLTVPMCSPLTDGAAAAVVCSGQAMARLGIGRGVRVLASTVTTGVNRALADDEQHITALAAAKAYEQAGVGPQDIDVAEVHDATAFAEIQLTEMLGLCEPGKGGAAAESGDTSIGGRLPVNPSGGLESKGHPLGATGLGQVFELVTQLRGEAGSRQVEGARVALAENAGGFYSGEEAVSVITVLEA